MYTAHLCNIVLTLDALLELATQPMLVVHHGMIQLQPGTAEFANSILQFLQAVSMMTVLQADVCQALK